MDNIFLLMSVIFNTAIMKFFWDRFIPLLNRWGIDASASMSLEYAFMSVVIPSLLVQLPIVERWLLYLEMGARKLTGIPGMRIKTALEIACQYAGKLPEDFNVYMSYSEDINASATGKNTIIVYKGAAEHLSIPELAGLIAHEMGHIVHRDSYYGPTIFAMNILFHKLISVLTFFGDFFIVIGRDYLCGSSSSITVIFGYGLSVLAYILSWILRLPGIIMYIFCPPSGPNGEKGADEYACEIGLGMDLYAALLTISRQNQDLSVAANWIDHHEKPRDRMNSILDYCRNSLQNPLEKPATPYQII